MTGSIKVRNGSVSVPVSSIKFVEAYKAEDLERMKGEYDRDCSELRLKLRMFNGSVVSIPEDATYLAQNGVPLVTLNAGRMVNANLVVAPRALSDKDKEFLAAREGENKLGYRCKVTLVDPTTGGEWFAYSTVPFDQFAQRVDASRAKAVAMQEPAEAPATPAQG